MKVSDIHNNNLIFIDNSEIIKKKKISTKNSIIFIFIGDEEPEKTFLISIIYLIEIYINIS